VLTLLPAIIYNLFLIPERSAGLFRFFVLSFSEWLLKPAFYLRWADLISTHFGFNVIILSLWGVLMFRPGGERGMMVGLWVGYVLYGLSLPYQIMTHDYYHLMLVPILGLCLAPPLAVVFHQLSSRRVVWRAAAVGVLLIAVFSQLWKVRVGLARHNYRNKAREWEIISEAIPRDGEVIALIEAYGYQLEYFAMIKVPMWPRQGDINAMGMRGDEFDYEQEFAKRTSNYDYFLVTDSHDFEKQDELQEILYGQYSIYSEGDEYVIFNLGQKLDDVEE